MNGWERGKSKLRGAKKRVKKKNNRVEENIQRSYRVGKVGTLCARWNEIN
jgi:hypothetical protein